MRWDRANLPNLSPLNSYETSPEATDYNCIAWAAGITDSWWEPDPHNIYFWPPGVPRDYSIDALIKAFESIGFSVCEASDVEDGFEKVTLCLARR